MKYLLPPLCLVLVAMTGCATTGPTPSRTASESVVSQGTPDPIVAVEVYAVPTILNWNHDPQPDGVEIHVFLFTTRQPLAQPMTDGTLQIAAYDGRPSRVQMTRMRPLHSWHLTAGDIVQHEQRGIVGPGYDLLLDWGRDLPHKDYVTIAVRYVPFKGSPIPAAPVGIPTHAGEHSIYHHAGHPAALIRGNGG